MRRSPAGGRLALALALALVLALAGCGALRLVYGQAAALSYWWLDRYVDFDGRQSPRVHQALDEWLDWQHRELLPRVLPWLDTLIVQAASPDIPAAQICERWTQITRWRDEAFAQAAPAIANLAMSLSAAQVDHVRQRQRAVLDEAREEFLQPDPEDRLAASVDRTVDRLKMLYGPITQRQRQQVRDWLQGSSPFKPERWIAQREERQTRLTAWMDDVRLRPPGDVGEAGRSLMAWWRDAVSSPAERADDLALEADNCQFASSFHAGTQAAQRQHLQDRLSAWRADLAAFAPAPPAPVRVAP